MGVGVHRMKTTRFSLSATFEGGLEAQARLMNEMGQFADAVVIITNQIATMEEVKQSVAVLLLLTL